MRARRVAIIGASGQLGSALVDVFDGREVIAPPHRAVPLTGALCLAVAARVPGSVAHALVRAGDAGAPLRLGHPSGTILVAADVRDDHGALRVPSATVFRTARRLFQGEVLYRLMEPPRSA